MADDVDPERDGDLQSQVSRSSLLALFSAAVWFVSRCFVFSGVRVT